MMVTALVLMSWALALIVVSAFCGAARRGDDALKAALHSRRDQADLTTCH